MFGLIRPMVKCMLDRRIEPRTVTSDKVEIRYTDQAGCQQARQAALHDTSPHGAGLRTEHPIPLLTDVRLVHEEGEVTGKVKYCVAEAKGYFIGVEFDPGNGVETPFSFSQLHNLRR